MGLVVFGQGVAKISGRVGGSIFANNRGGNYVKNFAVPVNPNTTPQQEVRSALSDLVVGWLDDLTDTQRAAWETYGENVAMTNRIGDTIFLTGQQHYIRSNSALVRLALTRVDDGPTTFNLGNFTPTTLAATETTPPNEASVGFTDTDDWVGEDDAHMIVQLAQQVNPTINFFKGPFLTVGTIDGNLTLPPTTPQVFTAPNGYTAGNKAFARVRVHRADGRLSSPQITEAIIVT